MGFFKGAQQALLYPDCWVYLVFLVLGAFFWSSNKESISSEDFSFLCPNGYPKIGGVSLLERNDTGILTHYVIYRDVCAAVKKPKGLAASRCQLPTPTFTTQPRVTCRGHSPSAGTVPARGRTMGAG